MPKATRTSPLTSLLRRWSWRRLAHPPARKALAMALVPRGPSTFPSRFSTSRLPGEAGISQAGHGIMQTQERVEARQQRVVSEGTTPRPPDPTSN
jgi:hypothetical protein